jgi:tRNA-specific adenosine deaminase 1
MQELEFLCEKRRQKPDPDSDNPSGVQRGSVDDEDEVRSCSRFIRWRSANDAGKPVPELLWPPFEFRKEVRIWLYCTCAPCGDASMELCMATQDDSTPWPVPANSPENAEPEQDLKGRLLDGRAHFSILGVVRRKPSRADAESTLSKSCSDKLAMKQVSSLLSFPTSLLIAPTPNAYLAGLVLPEEEISHVACERAFGKGETSRLKSLNDGVWIHSSGREEYKFRPSRSVPCRCST